jgi:hypothetical protein
VIRYYEFSIERAEGWAIFGYVSFDKTRADEIRSCTTMEESVDKVRGFVASDRLPVNVAEFLAGMIGNDFGKNSE